MAEMGARNKPAMFWGWSQVESVGSASEKRVLRAEGACMGVRGPWSDVVGEG